MNPAFASRSLAKLCCALLMLGVASGCAKVDLYSNLPEQEANEMMAILMKNGIACTKSPGEELSWTLSVSSGEFGRSVEILDELGYPREVFDDMGQMFQKTGLVSSPSEERIRFMHALSQELAQTISQIDGVLSARVHIVLPNNNPFGEEVQPSSAAVFIKHRQDAELDMAITKIKQLVVSSIEGLGPDNVTVQMFPSAERLTGDDELATPQPLANVLSVKVAPESVQRLWLLVGGAVAVAVVGLGAAVLAWLWPQPAAKAGGSA